MKKGIFIFLLILPLAFFFITNTRAQDVGCNQNDINCYNQKIQEFENKIKALSQQANTLNNQIAQFNAQISLTSLRITQTEEKILLLTGRIDALSGSLQSLTQSFSQRAIETYKMARFGDPVLILVASSNLSDVFAKFHYLKKIQEEDRDLLGRLKLAQTTYQDERSVQEALQTELTKQKANLDNQKAAKAKLLAATRNDEKRYQELLAKARAELEAIQAIIAGRGEETESGSVSEGQRIASIISSASPCSSGAHVHFEVVKDKANQNPANLLSPKSPVWDNAPDGQFSFSGSWQWPVNDPVRITQGYGMTYYATQLRYYGGGPHTGIDMLNANDDLTVKSVKPGTLYRGAIGCGGGTLRYVHVKQGDGYDTYYLHVNY